jgi:16S rRNA (adenine(1408)-N(1))-methyltransferase
VVDIGTGDGLFVYRSARLNPHTFFIGIDANSRPLEKISEKIHRKPAKGGQRNILFVQSAVEELPSELDGIAKEVTIIFPWGSLLRAVVTGEQAILKKLRSICSTGAFVKVVVSLDFAMDKSEIERLGLPPLSVEYVESVLRKEYESAGLEIVSTTQFTSFDLTEFETSWGRRLRQNASRSYIQIQAQAVRFY